MKENGIGPGQIIRRTRDGALEFERDELTVEEPLEIRIGNRTVATTMRTPGHDDELAAGFLLSEAIIRSSDVIEKFSRPASARNRENIITVHLAPNVRPTLNSTQRFGTISTSCGLCGKESIDAIRQNFPPIGSTSKHFCVYQRSCTRTNPSLRAPAGFMPLEFSQLAAKR